MTAGREVIWIGGVHKDGVGKLHTGSYIPSMCNCAWAEWRTDKICSKTGGLRDQIIYIGLYIGIGWSLGGGGFKRFRVTQYYITLVTA